MMNAAPRISYARISCVMSTSCTSGAIPNMTPFMIPANGSLRPKSVVSVIIISLASGPPSGSLRYAASRHSHCRPVPPRPKTMRRVYLDSNATTPMRPEVVAAMMPLFTEHFGNASSIHWFGQHAKLLIDDARQHVAKLINAETSEIVFVSGGTEADNFEIRGIAESQKPKGRHIITSHIEHHAVLHTCKDLEKHGYEISWLPVSREGLTQEMPRVQALRDRLEAGLKSQIEFIHVNAEKAPRLPNTSNIMVDFAEGEGLVISLDLKGVAVSTGSACSSGSLEPSHVLTAIGKTPDEAHGSLRFSLSTMTALEDIDYVIEVLPGIVDRLRELSPYYKKV